jgi:hypothetical protein
MLIYFAVTMEVGAFSTSPMSNNQVFLNEISASFAILYLSYGVGLDPRQALCFGSRLGPLLVEASLGLVSFATSGIVPGYSGAQMNPARYFAFGVAKRDFTCKLFHENTIIPLAMHNMV